MATAEAAGEGQKHAERHLILTLTLEQLVGCNSNVLLKIHAVILLKQQMFEMYI